MGKYGKYRTLVGGLAGGLVGGLAGAFALIASQASAEPCRQALAMGLDVSGSVDATEYRLQLHGLAAALGTPEVQDTLLSMLNAPVHLTVYEWSAPGDQRILVPWTSITSEAVLTSITGQLLATTRAPFGPSTAIGRSMAFGANLLTSQQHCWKRTLDISGDGRSNTGPRPQDMRKLALLDGITINALVIGTGGEARGDLNGYFTSLVLHGPDAFTEQADDFATYERAMVRKLLRELQGLAVSELNFAIQNGALPLSLSP